MSKPRKFFRRIGPIKVWAYGHNGEHPARWAGIWLPRIGEFEVNVTSANVFEQPFEEETGLGITITVKADPALDLTTVNWPAHFGPLS